MYRYASGLETVDGELGSFMKAKRACLVTGVSSQSECVWGAMCLESVLQEKKTIAWNQRVDMAKNCLDYRYGSMEYSSN